MFTAIFGAFESGIIYAIMALGVYLSFRVLDFPDLTVDGSFVTGAAVAATMIVSGANPFLATITALFAGFIAGCLTGIIHTFGKINALLSGILMMIALYSINLRIMGKSNVPLLNTETAITHVRDFWDKTGIDSFFNSILTMAGLGGSLPRTWGIILFMLVVTLAIKFLTDRFLQTEIGLALRATGDNKRMIRSLSANTNMMVILGLGLSNAMVAFSGALIAQQGGFADVGMGIGMIIIGLASVIIGEALFGTKTIARTTLAVIGGAIIYRIVVTMALRVEFLEPGDMKLITATIVILALIMPKIIDRTKEKKRKAKRLAGSMNISELPSGGKGETGAAIKSDS
ncbi:putative ABC transport system permease protein [Cytobacillus firmus]|uniref:Putative ABC transport system permease protein n=2 Tax=Cytobacillus TaxID=2675230 RepID=A0A366K3G6_CYTFI|nr:MULTISPECIES: ABC transporter permease [Cytobacillus]RBP96214.1 putative ABC transport system permease protein [Cytobacillus firmus]TDX46061.1 putative ABC transport system permease protein [Cytobacillus oceanisediminis]